MQNHHHSQDVNLSVVLKTQIDAYKIKHPRKSSNQIAREFEISTSAFHRIENRMTKRPGLEQTIKILQRTEFRGSIPELLKKYYPEYESVYARVYEGNADVPFLPSSQEEYFENIQTYELMLLAYSKTSFTREYIQENYGKRGLETLEQLLKKGILKEKDKKIGGATENINATQTTVKCLLNNLVANNYHLSGFGNSDNWLSIQFESVNKEKVMPQVSMVLKEANNKIRDIINDPQNSGKDVVWAGLAMDSLLNHNNHEGVLQ